MSDLHMLYDTIRSIASQRRAIWIGGISQLLRGGSNWVYITRLRSRLTSEQANRIVSTFAQAGVLAQIQIIGSTSDLVVFRDLHTKHVWETYRLSSHTIDQDHPYLAGWMVGRSTNQVGELLATAGVNRKLIHEMLLRDKDILACEYFMKL